MCPASKSGRIASMINFVSTKNLVESKSSAAGLVPGRFFIAIIHHVGEGRSIHSAHALVESVGESEMASTEAMFSIKSNTGTTTAKGPRIMGSPTTVARFGLGADVLKSEDGALGVGVGGKWMSESFAVTRRKGNPKHIELREPDGGKGGCGATTAVPAMGGWVNWRTQPVPPEVCMN